jgi:hypothetical protein
MGRAFDDTRRSRGFERIASIHSLALFTPDEFARFTPETREVVEFLVGR